MKFMMIIKANKDSEAGVMPSERLLLAMGKYNEQLVKAGVLLAGDGLQASSKGARINFANGKSTVVDGPFAETKELIAGYWIIQVKSKAEAIEWARRVPFDVDGQIEVRQLFEPADFEPELSGSAEGRALLEAEQNFRKRTNT
ncbi:MAG TPA: YciI family protein [Gemmatimonadaceae bacterium]|nr:YciI family protein [Gemmatimonadaceae bacterium]